jgi:hypothetical protein
MAFNRQSNDPGLPKRIDGGGRVFCSLFCYKKDGRDKNGCVKWTPVESEVEKELSQAKETR